MESKNTNKRKTTEDESNLVSPTPDKRTKNSSDVYEQYWVDWRKLEKDRLNSLKDEKHTADQETSKNSENELEEIQKILDFALRLKQEGNEKFKCQEYLEAVQKYNEAIDAAPAGLFKKHLKDDYEKFKLSIITNLALTFIKGQYWDHARCQSEEGLKMYPSNAKLKYYLG